MHDAAIVCEGVSYTYPGGARANDHIELRLERGELFCLLGRNGAGKTTLIRQVTAELRPMEGRILVLGKDAHRDPVATRQKLGIIPQTVGLFEGLTVEEHLRLIAPLKRLSMAEAPIEARRVLEECELGALQSRRVGTLSGGERRLLLIALALLGRPEILILDEPTAGLDPAARRSSWETIRKQCSLGVAVLLTTHYLDEAEQLADRVGFLEEGRMTHVGTLQQLYQRVGKGFRVTEYASSGKILQNTYFDTFAEARRFAVQLDLDSFAVSRVSLEDIYLRLIGRSIGADGA